MLWVGQLELFMLQKSKCGELLWLSSAAPSSLVPPSEIHKVKLAVIGFPHKTSQGGFLPHLQPKGSTQRDTSYPSVPRKRCKGTKELWSDSLMDP